MVVNSTAADWVISREGIGNLIIELKGTDVEHAVEQLEATARYWKENGYSFGKMSMLVVCRQYPAFDTKIQRAKQRFSREFGSPLHVVSGAAEFEFDRAFLFREHLGQ